MKTSLLKATTIVCGLAVVLAANVCLAQATPPRRPSGTNVAVIDVASVFDNHTRFKQRMEDVKRDIEAFEAVVRQEQKRLTGLREKMLAFNAGTDRYKQAEKELADATAGIQVRMQLKKRDFLEQEAKVYFNAYQEVLAAVAKFAERNSIGLVLRFNGKQMDPTKRDSVLQGVNRAVVYQRQLNITDFIVESLNVGVAPVVGRVPNGGRGPNGGQVPNVSRGPQIPTRRQ